MKSWPFADPRNVAVFTQREVFQGQPILRVAHDDEDGAWQFLAHDVSGDAQPMIVALEEIVKLDPSVAELADLPLGWCAVRKDRAAAWCRKKGTP